MKHPRLLNEDELMARVKNRSGDLNVKLDAIVESFTRDEKMNLSYLKKEVKRLEKIKGKLTKKDIIAIAEIDLKIAHLQQLIFMSQRYIDGQVFYAHYDEPNT